MKSYAVLLAVFFSQGAIASCGSELGDESSKNPLQVLVDKLAENIASGKVTSLVGPVYDNVAFAFNPDLRPLDLVPFSQFVLDLVVRLTRRQMADKEEAPVIQSGLFLVSEARRAIVEKRLDGARSFQVELVKEVLELSVELRTYLSNHGRGLAIISALNNFEHLARNWLNP